MPAARCSARQVLAGELADRAEDHRLGDRHGELPRHRPGKRLTAEAEQSAERHQRPAGGEQRAKPAVEEAPGGNRQHHVEQREDLREPADGGHRDPVVVRRLGVIGA